MKACIHQINASRGGVPKRSLSQAEVNDRGISVDEQRDKMHHGSPDQALCLYSLELIEELQQAGHPIFPGSTGENITTRGLEWGTVRPGAFLKLGAEVVIELTEYATPCMTISGSFADGDFNRINHLVDGASRSYARIIDGGIIVPGDPVELIDEETADRVARAKIKSFRWPQDF